jgi:hypothetical protein
MKNQKNIFSTIAIACSLFFTIPTKMCAAQSIYGKVSFIGTIKASSLSNVGEIGFRFRLSQSTCGSNNIKKERWITVKSGRVDGKYEANGINYKTAYSTLLTSMLTEKHVQIDNVPTCNGGLVNLSQLQIGIY